MEPKKSTPSVIARLMGLNELPPQELVQKPQRVLSENYLRKVASIGVSKKRSFHEHHSLRTSLEERKEFKDDYQVVKMLKGDKHLEELTVNEGKANLGFSVGTMTFSRQKGITAKCPLVGERPQTSKYLQDSSELVESKNDCTLKRNSLFSKHLHGLQGSLAPSHSRDMKLFESSCTSVCRDVDFCRKLRCKNEVEFLRSIQKLENDTVTCHNGEELGVSFGDTARSEMVTQNESCSPNTRIVVLKPICGQDESIGRYFSSSSSNEGSHSGDSKCAGFYSPERKQVGLKVRKSLVCDVGYASQRSTASREILEELSRRTRWRKTSFSTKIPTLGFRGGKTFAMKSMLLTPPSSCSSDWRKQYASFSSSDNVAIEATKQLSKRCQTTKEYKEIGLASRSNTLDKLFAKYHDSMRKHHKLGNGRHGLKDLDLSKFSKKQSKHEAFRGNWYWRPEESLTWARHKLRRHNSDQESSEPKNSKLYSGKSKSLPCPEPEGSHSTEDGFMFLDDSKNKLEINPLDPNFVNTHSLSCSITCSKMENKSSLQETRLRKDEMKNKLEEGSMYTQNVSIPKPSSMVVDILLDTESEVAIKPSGKFESEQFGARACILLEKEDDSYSHSTDPQQETLIGLHEESSVFSPCSGREPDFLASLEEAYQPSPVSVLEPPFTEENMYSSECLGRIKDDICDLRRQLELLKSETSETSSEGPGMAVSSDDEMEEGSIGESKENEAFMKVFRVDESRSFSYVVEVLTEAGLHGRKLEEFSSWHTPECPIGLSVFETLEKKYGDQMSWKRSERRLLFDRINAALMEILLPCVGVLTWEMSVSRRFSPTREEEMIEEDLWKLLVSQEKKLSENSGEKLLESELGKIELGDDVGAIGREIEILLFNELAAEIFSMESF